MVWAWSLFCFFFVFFSPKYACVFFFPAPVHRGDRIAQLILEKITTPDVVQVDCLPDTARGGAGFGSTGVS
jgi:hypothetical protein